MKRLMSNRKLWVIFFMIFVLFIVFTMPSLTSMGSPKNNSEDSSPLWTWQSEYILTFNGNNYTVTSEITKDVEKKIGSVSYHGNNPGSFYLYSLKNSSDFSKIAIETRDGYLIAVIHK